MTASRRRFEVVAPDWGQAHLTSDAVVAFVDGELSPAAHVRATRHLAACIECAAEVAAQGQARAALRSAHMPALSASLLHSLREIPRDVELPEPPAGLGIGTDGGFVQSLRALPPPAPRRSRRGTAVAVSGIALGALVVTASLVPSAPAPERGVFGGPVLNARPGGGPLDAGLQAPLAEPVSAVSAGPGAGESRTVEADTAVLRQLDAMPATFPVFGR